MNLMKLFSNIYKLAQIASGYKMSKNNFEKIIKESRKCSLIDNEVFNIETLDSNDWRKPIIDYLRNPNSNVERKLKFRVLHYVILGDNLFKKSVEGNLLNCLGNEEAYLAMAEVHEGICGAHQAGEKMKWTLNRQRVYWPTMEKDCNNYAKSCQECQQHGQVQNVPADELHSVIKPWPFRGWALDLIGLIHPPSTKGHRYILVAIDYFTKWVEAIPLKDVNQDDVINFIEENIIFRFGIPQTLTTDQGTVFVGRKVRQYAESRKIRMVNSTPYYAQANGQVEAANKIIIGLIKKHIGRKPRNWHETLN